MTALISESGRLSRIMQGADQMWVQESEDDLQTSKIFRFDDYFVTRSSKQIIEIFKSATHGSMLFLNHSLQLSTRESAHYHEMLVHVPMAYLYTANVASAIRAFRKRSSDSDQPAQAHQIPDNAFRPQRVLIVGGGDGGSLTEVLRYPSVTECVQVEWDAEVIRMAKQHLHDLAAGYADPRTRLVVADIADYLRDLTAQLSDSEKSLKFVPFDLIILDTTDLLQHGASTTLLKRLLSPQGILVAEVNTGGILRAASVVADTQPLRDAFTNVRFFRAQASIWVTGEIIFAFCSDAIDPSAARINWRSWLRLGLPLLHYNSAMHLASFALPNQMMIDLYPPSTRISWTSLFPIPSSATWRSISRIPFKVWTSNEMAVRAAVADEAAVRAGKRTRLSVPDYQAEAEETQRPAETQERKVPSRAVTRVTILPPTLNSSAASKPRPVKLHSMSPVLSSYLRARLNRSPRKMQAQQRPFRSRCREQILQTLCRSGSIGVLARRADSVHSRRSEAAAAQSLGIDPASPFAFASASSPCRLAPITISSKLKNVKNPIYIRNGTTLASRGQLLTTRTKKRHRTPQSRTFLHLTCQCSRGNVSHAKPFASIKDPVSSSHPDCAGGVDLGALFDSQDCTLWDFTLVYEKLLEQRYVSVDPLLGVVRLGDRSLIPADLCEGLSPAFPSSGLRASLELQTGSSTSIPSAASGASVSASSTTAPPDLYSSNNNPVGGLSSVSMAAWIAASSVIALPARGWSSEYAPHSFPHPHLGGRCPRCEGRGYLTHEHTKTDMQVHQLHIQTGKTRTVSATDAHDSLVAAFPWYDAVGPTKGAPVQSDTPAESKLAGSPQRLEDFALVHPDDGANVRRADLIPPKEKGPKHVSESSGAGQSERIAQRPASGARNTGDRNGGTSWDSEWYGVGGAASNAVDAESISEDGATTHLPRRSLLSVTLDVAPPQPPAAQSTESAPRVLPASIPTVAPTPGSKSPPLLQFGAASSLLQRFKAIVEARPSNTFSDSKTGATFDQGSIDYRDVLQRALFVDERGDLADKRLLIVGDDDLFSVVAALSGEPALIVVLEKDPRLVDYINQISAAHDWADWLIAFVYDVQYRLDDNLLASHPLADQLRRRGLSTFQHAFDVFLCDPPDTVESYALWLSRAAASLRGASSAMYISTTRIEASAHKWLQFQRMFLASGFIVSDLRRQFTRYPTSEDDFREFDLIPRLHAVHAMQRSAVSWYSSSFVRLLLVNEVAVPMIDGDWIVNELLYTDEEQFPTLPPKALRKLWRVQHDWLRQQQVAGV